MADTVATPAAPAAPATNPLVAAKAAAVASISKKPDAPVVPKAETTPAAPTGIAELAKLSARNRELEALLKDPPALKEAREAYAKDPKAGLAKFLGLEAAAVDGELVKLSAAYFGAPDGTPEKAEAKDDLESKVAALEAKAKADEEARKSSEEKAKESEALAHRTAARDATYKILDGFVDADGVPTYPYSAINKEEANGHVVRTANEIAGARKLDLPNMPDEEVVALLREANELVEAEYAEVAAKYASVVPKAKKDGTVTETTQKPGPAKVNSAPVRTATGNVAKPIATPIANKTHVTIKEAKDALKKQLASARRN
jgi:hypothetical protein